MLKAKWPLKKLKKRPKSKIAFWPVFRAIAGLDPVPKFLSFLPISPLIISVKNFWTPSRNENFGFP